MKKITGIVVMILLVTADHVQSQTNYSFSINSILNSMPAGLRLPDGTIVKADRIATGGGVHSAASGTVNPTMMGGTFTGNTLPQYEGDHTPATFSIIETTSSTTIDNGISNNAQKSIGFHIYFDRPTLKISFLAVDIDGFNTSPGNAEWVSEFAFNGNTYVPYDHIVDPSITVANLTVNTSSPTHTWRTLITNTIGAAAAANLPASMRIERAAGGGIQPDNLNGQVLFNPSNPSAAVTDFFLLWGIWQVPASPTVQTSGLSPVVVKVSPDFGDVPDSYKTLLASDGASHGVTGTLSLGVLNTTEADGLPSPLANGDIGDDGVAAIGILPNNGSISQLISSYSIATSFINNSGLAANYVAWVDWNNNGLFDASEGQVTSTAPGVVSGIVTFTWNNVLLSGAVGVRATYARIRVTTESIGVANVGGAFRDGETEDYLIPFAVALPLQLISFEGRVENNRISLNWKTAMENNTAGFEIQYSSDGRSFANIGYVNAIGTGSNAYTFRDINAAQPANFYRLKIADHDGGVSNSRTIVLKLAPTKTIELKISPNPARDILTINIAYAEPLLITVFDTYGRKVKEQSYSSSNFISIDCSGLSSGMYYIRAVNNKGESSTAGFMKE